MVVLPAAESPTTPRMIGRAMRLLRLVGAERGCLVLGLAVLREHAALKDVVRRDGHQVVARDHAALAEEAVRLAQARPVDRVADAAPVGEAWTGDAPLEVGAH